MISEATAAINSRGEKLTGPGRACRNLPPVGTSRPQTRRVQLGYSCERALLTIRQWNLPMEAGEEQFRRMTFVMIA
jgi:hypothetical protein